MENLWPVELSANLAPSTSSWSLIEAQAAAIRQATLGLVHGEWRSGQTSIGRSSALFLRPADEPLKDYQFMAVRSAGEDFPLAIEVFHLGEDLRITHVRNESELRRTLIKILGRPETIRIVRSLASEAAAVRAIQVNGGGDAAPSPADNQPIEGDRPYEDSSPTTARPIAIGGLINEQGVRFATVTLLGIAGFVRLEELRKLVMRPDLRGSAIQSLNGRFVVTTSFADSVKMTLSADELKVLQNGVRQALAGDVAS